MTSSSRRLGLERLGNWKAICFGSSGEVHRYDGAIKHQPTMLEILAAGSCHLANITYLRYRQAIRYAVIGWTNRLLLQKKRIKT